MELLGDFKGLVPGQATVDFNTGSFEQIGAVHHHRAFAVERGRIKLAIVGNGRADRRHQVIDVIVGTKIIKRCEPAFFSPDRHFVGTNGHDVILTAFGGDVSGNALTQGVFLERDPLKGNVRILGGEIIRQLLHADHVTVVDRSDGQFRFGIGVCNTACQQRTKRYSHYAFHISSQRTIYPLSNFGCPH